VTALDGTRAGRLAAEARRTLADGGVPLLAGRTIRYAGDVIVHRAAARRVRGAARSGMSLDAALDFVYDFDVVGVTIAPMQVRAELREFMSRVNELRPRRLVEIGTAQGGTLFLLAQAAAPDATIVSVDLPGGRFGGGYVDQRAIVYREFARPGQRLELLRADSHDRSTIEAVAALVGDVDLLFIDGDHTLEGVRSDFADYSPFVRPGGLVALHDVVDGSRDLVGGVPAFWREIKTRYPTEELVADPGQGGYGIGLLPDFSGAG
jgi:predicted O-methyltransferase YrrM